MTFPRRSEFEKAKDLLDAMDLPYEVISPDPGLGRVGAAALAVGSDAQGAFYQGGAERLVCSGWVDYRPAGTEVPQEPPPQFEEDVFGEAAIMLLAPCVADRTRIRIIAHLSGDLTEVLPYMNAEMPEACYNHRGPTFTFLDGCRMVSLYPRRIAVAKADDIVDAWRVLESIRRRANETWARRGQITPSYEMRERPPALEIFKRLPGTNCGQCGQQTCLAFAVSLWGGGAAVSQCKPVFRGEYVNRKDALIEICAGLGVSDNGLD
ncbi:MAG TPA: (Fe-S)-binding protein [Phycisphaerae bacterium]|nr:(Fe-S)-binding protein [Phycisphaerae bacterium]